MAERRFALAGFILAVCMLAALVFPAPPSATMDESAAFLADDGRLLRVFLNSDDQWLLPWPSGVEVPQTLERAVTAAEDRYFRAHPGVNPAAVIRAALQNIRTGEIVSGASTITMQLARVLDPKPRTVASKVVEAVQALRFELRLGKAAILKRYLTYAPYGGNTIGAPAASLRYFGKEIGELTWAEAATLAVLPRSPGLIHPAADPEILRARRDALLELLLERGEIDDSTFELALNEPIPDRNRPFPFETPHLTRHLFEIQRERSGVVRTHIDLNLQREIERIVRVHSRFLTSLGIDNLSILVADTESGDVKSYVGSHDYFDAATDGQVDGVMAQRSTGSILKPFLYALAIDSGLILPETILIDIPSHFGTFHPKNVDLAYYGMLPASEALQRSLNVPAVRLLSDYGYRDFYRFLEMAGATTLFRSPDDYGLTLILGGAETTLFDLVRLYRGLGRFGEFGDLSLFEAREPVDGEYVRVPRTDGGPGPVRLLSPGASWLVLETLTGLTRPGPETWWERQSGSYPLAWKTGTSYGNRDAWAVGVSPDWIIGVWIGNFSGVENVNLRSTNTSAPLLFDVFNVLPKQTHWFGTPADALRSTAICLDTGYVAGDACERIRMTDVPMSAPSLPVCPFHRFVVVEGDYEVCSLCWDRSAADHRRVSRLFYPADAVQYLSDRGVAIEAVPTHNPACPTVSGGGNDGIAIVYPQQGGVVYLPRDLDGSLQRLNLRAAHRESRVRLFWYLNDEFLGETFDRHALPVDLDAGEHELLVVDEYGTRQSIAFTVVTS